MHEYRMEHLFSCTVDLKNPPEIIGPTPDGLRINFYIAGGAVTGQKISGRFLPVGADWAIMRTDGVGVLDIRATIETNDGALVYVAYQGVIDAGKDGYQQFLEGNTPPTLPLRGAPRLMTSHPDYLWLNRLQCVNVGEADVANSTVAYDLYAIR